MLLSLATAAVAQKVTGEVASPLAALSFAAKPFEMGLKIAFGGLTESQQNKAFHEAASTAERGALVAGAESLLRSLTPTTVRTFGL